MADINEKQLMWKMIEKQSFKKKRSSKSKQILVNKVNLNKFKMAAVDKGCRSLEMDVKSRFSIWISTVKFCWQNRKWNILCISVIIGKMTLKSKMATRIQIGNLNQRWPTLTKISLCERWLKNNHLKKKDNQNLSKN